MCVSESRLCGIADERRKQMALMNGLVHWHAWHTKQLACPGGILNRHACCYTAVILQDSAADSQGNRLAQLSASAAALSKASSIVIVGGGYVGVELAAEVVGRYGRSKSVVLVSSTARCVQIHEA